MQTFVLKRVITPCPVHYTPEQSLADGSKSLHEASYAMLPCSACCAWPTTNDDDDDDEPVYSRAPQVKAMLDLPHPNTVRVYEAWLDVEKPNNRSEVWPARVVYCSVLYCAGVGVGVVLPYDAHSSCLHVYRTGCVVRSGSSNGSASKQRLGRRAMWLT